MFGANSTEILILASMLILVLILLATFRGRKKKPTPPPARPLKPRKPRLDPLGAPGLSAYDRDVLGRLAWLFRTPGNAHKITSDEDAFLRAARRALAEGIATLDELRTLARHLGFDAHKLGEGGLSTLKLGAGIEISVADATMNSGAGEITTNLPSALKVRLRSGQTSFKPGRKVDVICKGKEGLYRFETTVQAQEGRRLLLDHTSDLERVQRRKHRRRQMRMPVELRVGSVSAASRTEDISIGGSAVRNPRKRFGPGQRLSCSFSFGGDEKISIPATVVRTSRGNSLLHLRFNNVEDGTRHRLFRAIMKASAK
ncbi:MAG: PilZ domain-containing protein [Spirochaetaceae bacterium]